MSRVLIILAIFLVMFPGCKGDKGMGCAKKKEAGLPTQPLVFIDAREEIEIKSEDLEPGEKTRRLEKLFGQYGKDKTVCGPDSSKIGSESDGRFVPSIEGKVTGSFTAPNAKETVYLIWLNECFAHIPNDFGTRRIAVFSGDELVFEDIVPDKALKKLGDLNGDGIDEILLTHGWVGQGHIFQSAQLVQLAGGKVNEIIDFQGVSDDSCGSGMEGAGRYAKVITKLPQGPGKMPKFSTQYYKAPCTEEASPENFQTTTERGEEF